MDIVDTTLKRVSKTSDGLLKIKDVYENEFEALMRSGDLTRMSRAVGKDSTTATVADKKSFSDLAQDLPEKVLRDIRGCVDNHKVREIPLERYVQQYRRIV